jgi:UPF0716 protein FxsA
MRVIYVLFAVFIVLPLLELWVLIQVGTVIGALPTIGLIVAISLFGAWMVRRQSLAALLKAQASLNGGLMPVGAVADGAGLMLAALLIMTPGLITSAVGAVLLVPAIRRLFTGWVMRTLLKNAVVMQSGFPGRAQRSHQGRPRQSNSNESIRRPQSADAAQRGKGPVIDAEYEAMDDPDAGTDDLPRPAASGPASPWNRP